MYENISLSVDTETTQLTFNNDRYKFFIILQKNLYLHFLFYLFIFFPISGKKSTSIKTFCQSRLFFFWCFFIIIISSLLSLFNVSE